MACREYIKGFLIRHIKQVVKIIMKILQGNYVLESHYYLMIFCVTSLLKKLKFNLNSRADTNWKKITRFTHVFKCFAQNLVN